MKSFTSSARLSMPAGSVFELITTPEYVEFSYPESRNGDLRTEILRHDEETFHYQVLRRTDATQVPRLLRRAMGGQVRIIQDHVWQLAGPPFEGRLTIRVAGVDGIIETGLKLVDYQSQQSEYRAEGRVDVNIPFIGGEIERFLAGRADTQFEQGVASIRAWLTHRRRTG